ncbi:MAG TPA: FAD-binding oxidoreductase, partial [Myxococcota bacterium]|nr:FAD-binding oxidoreductase [Myxococcota bacterium]
DGVIFPWPFAWGYAERARQMGVHIATFTPAVDVVVEGGKVTAVETPRGRIRCDLVVNAAAAWAGEVAAMVGLTLPNRPERHEILVTESLKPCVDPLIAEIGTGLYYSQSMRGEIVAGMGDPEQPHGIEMRSSLRFLTRISRALVMRQPALAHLQVVRQWAGCYDVTPDGNPVLGEVDAVAGFFQLHGFVGHGFMMAPAVGRRVGAYIARGQGDPIFETYRLSRFQDARGSAVPRETMIIG